MQVCYAERQAAAEAQCKQKLGKCAEASAADDDSTTTQLQEEKPSKLQLREGVDPVGSEDMYYWRDSHDRLCVEFFAKAHKIADAENPSCWKFVTHEIRPKIHVHLAELLKSSRLEVEGHHDVTKLTPNTKYNVSINLAVKADGAVGWEHPVRLELTNPYGKTNTAEMKLDEYRGKGQKKIKIADFLCGSDTEKCSSAAQVSIKIYAPGDHSMSGLIFRGVVIEPTK